MKTIITVLTLALNVMFFSAEVSASEGVFVDGGAHKTSGMAKVITDLDGRTILKFSNFTTDTGPKVKVYLSKGIWPQDIVDLGEIEAFSGDQEYVIPAGTNLNELNHVVIWCEQFNALFGYAKLEVK
jgi:hypothetical protein